MGKYLDLALEFAEDHLLEGRVWHAQNTLSYIHQLDPKADEHVKVAAVLHDIERGKGGGDLNELVDKDYLVGHQQRSADLAKSFLEAHDAEPDFVKKVYDIVLNHENARALHPNYPEENDKGDKFVVTPESMMVTDADSMSFFENIKGFIDYYPDCITKENLKTKIDFMYHRMSEERKRFVEPVYKKAIERYEAL